GANENARMLDQNLTKGAQLGTRVCGSGRIAGTVQQHQTRLRRDGSGKLAWGDLVALRHAGERHDWQPVSEQHHVGVRHPVGRGDDRLIARIEHRHAEVEERLLGPGGHQDLRALVAEGVVALELRDDGVLQLIDPLDVRVAREATADRVDAGLTDVCRRVEIGLSGPQTDDVLALRLEAGSTGGYRERWRGAGALEAARSGARDWNSWKLPLFGL